MIRNIYKKKCSAEDRDGLIVTQLKQKKSHSCSYLGAFWHHGDVMQKQYEVCDILCFIVCCRPSRRYILFKTVKVFASVQI